MSFRLTRYVYFAARCLIGIFFFLFGVLALVIPWSSHLGNAITQLMTQNAWIFSLAGLGISLIGLAVLFFAFLKLRRSYIEIRTGDLNIILDENVVYQYLETYWKKQFPDSKIPFSLNVKKQSLQIFADLPPMPLTEQKIFLEKVNQDFSHLFGQVLGYPYDVQIFAHFQDDIPPSVLT